MHVKTLSFLLAMLTASAVQAETYLFTNGHVLAMNGDGPTRGEVLVVGERIAAVGSVPDGLQGEAVGIDMAGGYLMPGLAEMHAHVPRADQDPAYLQDVLFLWVAHGITTVRGMLGHLTHLELREDILAHRVFGPRLITSGPSFNGNSVSDPEQAARMVRQQHAAGYDFLKIHPGLTLAEYDAMAEAAHSLGIPFAGHVPVDVGLGRALKQGQASIDHIDGFVHALIPQLAPEMPGYGSLFGVGLVDRVDLDRLPSLVQATRRAGVSIVPTETLLENFAGDLGDLMQRPEVRFLPQALLERYRRAIAERTDGAQAATLVELRKIILHALHEGGVNLLLGSDSPQIFNVPGFSIHRELQTMVAAGIPPGAAIAAGTVNPARYFGMADQFGRIAPGYAADLVLVGGNPLADIRHTADIRGVMVRGRWLGEPERRARLAEIAARYAE